MSFLVLAHQWVLLMSYRMLFVMYLVLENLLLERYGFCACPLVYVDANIATFIETLSHEKCFVQLLYP